jgi:hypothetical protein
MALEPGGASAGGFTIKGIVPDLRVLGDYQRFNYNINDNVTRFELSNHFIPTANVHSRMNLEFKNSELSGFRWYQKTLFNDTTGSFALQSFVNNEPDGIDMMIFGGNGAVNFLAPVNISNDLNINNNKIINLKDPVNNSDAATKGFVLETVGSISVGGNITLTGDIVGEGTTNESITTTFTGNPTFSGNSFMRIPVGTTAQRPLVTLAGMIRINTDI